MSIHIGLKQTGKVFVQRLDLTDPNFVKRIADSKLWSIISFPYYYDHGQSDVIPPYLTAVNGNVYNYTGIYLNRSFEDKVKSLENKIATNPTMRMDNIYTMDVTVKEAATDPTGTSPYRRTYKYESRSSIACLNQAADVSHLYNDLVYSTKGLKSVLTGRGIKARIVTKYALFKPGTNLKVFKTLDTIADSNSNNNYLENPITGKRTTYSVIQTRIQDKDKLYNRKYLPKHANTNDGDNNYAADDHVVTEAGAYGFLTLGSRDPAVSRLGSELSDGDVIAAQSWLILSDETMSEDMWPDLKDEMNPCAIPLTNFMAAKLKVIKGYIEKLTEIRLDRTFKRVRNGVETSYTFGSNPTVDLKPLDKLVFKYAVTTEPSEPDAAVLARGDKVDKFITSMSYSLVNSVDNKDYMYTSTSAFKEFIHRDMNEIVITIPDNSVVRNVIKYRGGKLYNMYPNFYIDHENIRNNINEIYDYTTYRIQRYYNSSSTTRYPFKVTFNN